MKVAQAVKGERNAIRRPPQGGDPREKGAGDRAPAPKWKGDNLLNACEL